jgi:hypothetical protein
MRPRARGRGSGRAEVDEAVEEFLESLDLLTETQLLEIHAVWQGRDPQAREDAWTAAIAAAATSGLGSRLEQARDAALSWAMRGTNVPWPYGFNESAHLDVRRRAGPALADASVAILLEGRLNEASRSVLIAPWLRAVERAG